MSATPSSTLSGPAALEETEAVFFERAGLDRGAAERILDDALAGADDGELYLQYAVSEGLTLDDSRLSGATYDISQGFGLRAVAGETTGYAHAASLDEPALGRAAEAVRAVSSGHGGVLALPPASANRRLYGPENPLDAPDFAEKAALLGRIDAYAPRRGPPRRPGDGVGRRHLAGGAHPARRRRGGGGHPPAGGGAGADRRAGPGRAGGDRLSWMRRPGRIRGIPGGSGLEGAGGRGAPPGAGQDRRGARAPPAR